MHRSQEVFSMFVDVFKLGHSFDPSPWRHVDVPDHFSDTRLLLLQNNVHEDVEELYLSSCNCLTTDGIIQLAKQLYFPRLKTLSIPICIILPDEVCTALNVHFWNT
ncbi:hypothetical protein LSH36_1062g00008 [Paralvinella palmiformis]|uniref:Uncharacterized protein n=1 Tax=Paralvinella palmiformis TaxID=53620 RepID=A0AAD9MRY7_9ANNE|nr:hypothetical protein LSH36_1062g00008 [Paralvinella palmiformis]